LADEFIRVGMVTWRYDPEFDTAFDEDAINRMPENVQKQFIIYVENQGHQVQVKLNMILGQMAHLEENKEMG
jgi:hypothetical protein